MFFWVIVAAPTVCSAG